MSDENTNFLIANHTNRATFKASVNSQLIGSSCADAQICRTTTLGGDIITGLSDKEKNECTDVMWYRNHEQQWP